MERKIPSSIGDFTALLQRRKYWIIFPTPVVIGLAIACSSWIPRTYKSTTTIMVQPQNAAVLSSGHQGSENESSDDVAIRVQKLALEVTTGNGMTKIINDLNLYPELRKEGKTSRILGVMRKNTSVERVADTGVGKSAGVAFAISYIGDTPQQAHDVAAELANLFVQENSEGGQQQLQRIDTFLRSQLEQAGAQLAAQQAKIQAFKDAHLGSLPEQAQVNLQMISQLQADQSSNSAAIDQDNQQRVYLQSVLNINPVGDVNGGAAPEAPSPLQIELAQKQADLNAALSKYTPQYPDVIRLKRDIKQLEIQIKNTPKSSAASPIAAQLPQATGPTTTDQLRSQLIALNSEIKSREARQRQIQAKLEQLQGSVGTVPAVQTEYERLDSDYQEMQKNYNVLLEKEHEAAMALALGRRDQGGDLVIVQPASLPNVPFSPNPVLIYMGSIFIGLFVGFVCALIVELRDDTIHNSQEAAAYLKLPVIVALPKFPTSST